MKVIIDESKGEFSIYDESGQAVEVGFKTEDEANQYAVDNGYEVVTIFNTRRTVKLLGYTCHLQFSRYSQNNTIALTAVDVTDGLPVATCSVNWEQNWEGNTSYKKTFAFPAVVIKNYSENEGIAEQLAAAGVLESRAYMAGTNGGVHVCVLTPEWQEIAKEQLNIK